MKRHALLCSALLFVTACDNPGTPAPPDPPRTESPNMAPFFLAGELLTLTTEENNTERLILVLATDPNLDTITVEISAQEDGTLFTFEDGGLSFTNPPDFENPNDTDMDNVYVVIAVATDPAGLQATQRIEITVTDVTDEPTLKRIGKGFDKPLGLVPIPGDTRLAVFEQGGRIRVLDPADGTIESVDFLTLTGLPTGNKEGLLGLAFAPDFETSRQFYVYLTSETKDNTEIRRYTTFSGRRDMGDPATETLILTLDQPRSYQNAGWIEFLDQIDFNPPANGLNVPFALLAEEYANKTKDPGESSVTGGIAYEGKLESLAEQYIFSDLVTGNIWTVPLKDLGADSIPAEKFTVLSLDVDNGVIENISAFATGSDGTAYIITLCGDIFEIVAAE